MNEQLTVGEVARLTNVSVRTLHHYDPKGLLVPSARSAAGYRLYTRADLSRLQQILVYRELDFSLPAIGQILQAGDRDASSHLRAQHRLLREQILRRQALLATLERELEAKHMGISLTPEEQFEVFGTDKVGAEWADEAEARWGDTPAWQQSQRRTAAYSRQDWAEVQSETDALSAEFAACAAAGEPATGERARSLAEAHRRAIDTRFYDCPPAMHCGLAELYTTDERFRANFEKLRPGLADYIRSAIRANAGL